MRIYALALITNHESRITNHKSQITSHESRITNVINHKKLKNAG